MAFTERFEYKLEIIPPWSIIQCRKSNIVEKDGKEIGRSYERTTYGPGDDITDACEEVKKVASTLWDQDLITSYKLYVKEKSQETNN